MLVQIYCLTFPEYIRKEMKSLKADSQDILTKVINDTLTIAVMSNLYRNIEIDACSAAMIAM